MKQKPSLTKQCQIRFTGGLMVTVLQRIAIELQRDPDLGTLQIASFIHSELADKAEDIEQAMTVLTMLASLLSCQSGSHLCATISLWVAKMSDSNGDYHDSCELKQALEVHRTEVHCTEAHNN